MEGEYMTVTKNVSRQNYMNNEETAHLGIVMKSVNAIAWTYTY